MAAGDNRSPQRQDESRQPPNLEKLLEGAFSKINPFSNGGGLGSIISIALVVLTAFGLWTTYYTVPSDSVAIVQRFGKYLKEVPPGLHFKLPMGIDTATLVPVKRQLKQEFGFATAGAQDAKQAIRPRNAVLETQMVTGDLNAALVEWVVQYRIYDPVRFLFEVREPKETLRYVS
ncbi:MAG: membrane protease subunit HflK, partial [Candidatus Azotimanducaceae bacterium]